MSWTKCVKKNVVKSKILRHANLQREGYIGTCGSQTDNNRNPFFYSRFVGTVYYNFPGIALKHKPVPFTELKRSRLDRVRNLSGSVRGSPYIAYLLWVRASQSMIRIFLYSFTVYFLIVLKLNPFDSPS